MSVYVLGKEEGISSDAQDGAELCGELESLVFIMK